MTKEAYNRPPWFVNEYPVLIGCADCLAYIAIISRGADALTFISICAIYPRLTWSSRSAEVDRNFNTDQLGHREGAAPSLNPAAGCSANQSWSAASSSGRSHRGVRSDGDGYTCIDKLMSNPIAGIGAYRTANGQGG